MRGKSFIVKPSGGGWHARIVEGLDIPVENRPEQVISQRRVTARVALVGADYPGLRPSMSVDVGQRVRAGEALFTDRRYPELAFTSPAGGVVREINRGARRALASVVVERDGRADEPADHSRPEPNGWESRSNIIKNICKSGLWPAFRTRPFGRIADPAFQPPAIFVTAIDTDPLAVLPAPIIDGRAEDFTRGLRAIAWLTEGPLHLCLAPGHTPPEADIPNLRTTNFSGPHPAGLVGTHMHFLHPASRVRPVWHIGYQDVIAIGAMIETGRPDDERIVGLAGPGIRSPRLIRTSLGADIAELTSGELNDGHVRVVSGSILSGRHAIGQAGFLGRYHDKVSVLEDVSETRSDGFSSYLPGWLARASGIRRASRPGRAGPLLSVGGYERVFPLNLLATPLLRALLARDLETAAELGALELDAEDLALLSFVCPGKNDFGNVLRDCLDAIERGQ